MTRTEWLNSPKELQGWDNYGRARKALNPGNVPYVVLHHKNFNCTNYEQWVIEELIPLFKWCHIALHGRFTTVETREKIAKANRGKKRTNKQRQQMSESAMGNKNATGKRSEEFRQKLSEINTGKHLTEEHKKSISESHRGKPNQRKGLNLPETTKEKMKGRIPWNKGRKGIQVAWNKGIPMTSEQRMKLSKVHIERLKNPIARTKCLANLIGGLK